MDGPTAPPTGTRLQVLRAVIRIGERGGDHELSLRACVAIETVQAALHDLHREGWIDYRPRVKGRERRIIVLRHLPKGFATTPGTTSRACLMCRLDFPSEGAGHRICDTCKETEDWQDGPDFQVADPQFNSASW